METKEPAPAYSFRWRYVVLPVAVLLVSLIVVAFFFSRLPMEMAYRFDSDGSPLRSVARSTVLLWTLGPQVLLTLAALLVTRSMTALASRFIEPGTAIINPEIIFKLMGNMPAMPQVILSFAMLDIFSYNSYKIHLPPVWIFAAVILVLGGIIISIFSFRAMRLVWKANKE